MSDKPIKIIPVDLDGDPTTIEAYKITTNGDEVQVTTNTIKKVIGRIVGGVFATVTAVLAYVFGR